MAVKTTFKKKSLVFTLALGAFLGMETQAAFVDYILDQTNIETIFPDGQPYLTVRIEDGLTFGADTNAVRFTVDVIDSVFTSGGVSKGNNFGIRDFGFNLAAGAPTVADSNIVGPSGWVGNVVPPNNQLDGFGRFTADIKGTGTNRFDPLVFWITGVVGDTIASYAAPSTNGNGGPAVQGNAWFAAHVGDFIVNGSTINNGYFGGGNGTTPPSPVPLPAAAWLMLSALVGGGLIARRKN
jgi:hypothetical protein